MDRMQAIASQLAGPERARWDGTGGHASPSQDSQVAGPTRALPNTSHPPLYSQQCQADAADAPGRNLMATRIATAAPSSWASTVSKTLAGDLVRT